MSAIVMDQETQTYSTGSQIINPHQAITQITCQKGWYQLLVLQENTTTLAFKVGDHLDHQP
ncbi:hypothetical protein Leryth_001997 [Lithospermum erythrorhizon]|nr:hypothetical protein Leryth_001997 [Lithospermum erythrorhizon]